MRKIFDTFFKKYAHKCGQDNNTIIKQPTQSIIDSKNETVADFQPNQEIKRIPKSKFPDYESNPRIQRMRENKKNENI